MSPHPAEHERRLQEALDDERPLSAARLRAVAGDCADCQAAVDALRELGGLLDRTAAEERECDLAAGPAARPGLASGGRRSPPPGARRLLFAAAVLLFIGAAAVFHLWPSGIDSTRPVTLLHGDFEILEPGDVGDFRRFRWQAVAGGVTYVVKVYDGREEPARSRLLVSSPPTDRTEWTPTAAQVAALPDRIHVRVEARGTTGGELVARSAWRTSTRR